VQSGLQFPVAVRSLAGLVGSLLDGDFSCEFFDGVVNPGVVLANHFTGDEREFKEEFHRQKVVGPDLRGDRGDVKLVEDIVICFSLGLVSHGCHGVAFQGS